MIASCSKEPKIVIEKGISIEQLPEKTTYYCGDLIDYTGIKVCLKYSDGSKKDITNSPYLSLPNYRIGSYSKEETPYNLDIEIKYTDETNNYFTDSFKICVEFNDIKSFEITNMPNKLTYKIGEYFNVDGLKAKVVFLNGETRELDENSLIFNDDENYYNIKLTELGENEITVKYGRGGSFATQKIKVNVIGITNIDVTTLPSKTEYYLGEMFEKDGTVVTATYSNGVKEDLPLKNCNFDYDRESNEKGERKVTVTYYENKGKSYEKELKTDFNINVIAQISKIEITKKPKLVYHTGEEFSSEGMEIEVTYMHAYNGYYKETITSGWNVFDFDSTTPSENKKKVTISYSENNFTKEEYLYVEIKRTLLSIEIISKIDTYLKDEPFDKKKIEVKASYDFGDSEFVLYDDLEVSGFDSSDYTKNQKIKISYSECGVTKSVEYPINVDKYRILPAGTDGTYGTNGTYYEFGFWPQSVKENNITIDENNTKNVGMFTYYKGSDDYWYVKVVDKNEEEYFYKVEPIKWRKLNDNNLFLAENSLFSMNFSDRDENYNLGEQTIYPNNYEYSAVRAFLNGIEYPADDDFTYSSKYKDNGFLQTAFNEDLKELIKDTEITTKDCNDTEDKLFILDVSDLENNDNYINTDTSRIREYTRYANHTFILLKGYGGNGWVLRTPIDLNPWSVKTVDCDGKIDEDATYFYVPALYLNLQ